VVGGGGKVSLLGAKQMGYYSLRLKPEFVEQMKKLALKISFERGERITWSRLIREWSEEKLKEK
jgi:hypothetical protein